MVTEAQLATRRIPELFADVEQLCVKDFYQDITFSKL